MASITVPGVVDSVTINATGSTTTITTHPSTDRPSVTVQLKEAIGPSTFADEAVVSVTIETT